MRRAICSLHHRIAPRRPNSQGWKAMANFGPRSVQDECEVDIWHPTHPSIHVQYGCGFEGSGNARGGVKGSSTVPGGSCKGGSCKKQDGFESTGLARLGQGAFHSQHGRTCWREARTVNSARADLHRHRQRLLLQLLCLVQVGSRVHECGSLDVASETTCNAPQGCVLDPMPGMRAGSHTRDACWIPLPPVGLPPC